MTRHLTPFLFFFLLIQAGAGAQIKKNVYTFPFDAQQNGLTQKQMQLADSLYQNLPDGEKLQLNLLSAEEQARDQAIRSQLSYQRAALLMAHYRKTGLSDPEYCAEFVPFQMPNVVRTHDLTRAYSISIGRKSQAFVVLTKMPAKVTSTAAVNFDADFSPDMQTFNLNPNREMNVMLASGTTIYIPANSLQQTNGQDPGCRLVTLRVSEYLDLDAVAMKAMTTTSTGKKLETGGMWYIDVVCNGQPLVMKPGMEYSINVSIKGEVKDMRVFTGRMKGGLLDWKEETDNRVIVPGEQNAGGNNETDASNEEAWAEDEPYDSTEYRFDREVMDRDNRYSLQLNDFGWINCDAFSESPEVTDLMVMGEISKKSNVMLVYGKRNSILPGYLCEDGKSVKFSDVATDETAMLVVFEKTDEKGGVKKYTCLLQPGKNKNISVNLTASTAGSLRSEIRSKLSDL